MCVCVGGGGGGGGGGRGRGRGDGGGGQTYSKIDGSFTMAHSNLFVFLVPYEILLIAQENIYLGVF